MSSGFTLYRLLDSKAFTARRMMGARTLIDGASWRAYFESLPAYVAGASTHAERAACDCDASPENSQGALARSAVAAARSGAIS